MSSRSRSRNVRAASTTSSTNTGACSAHASTGLAFGRGLSTSVGFGAKELIKHAPLPVCAMVRR